MYHSQRTVKDRSVECAHPRDTTFAPYFTSACLVLSIERKIVHDGWMPNLFVKMAMNNELEDRQ